MRTCNKVLATHKRALLSVTSLTLKTFAWAIWRANEVSQLNSRMNPRDGGLRCPRMGWTGRAPAPNRSENDAPPFQFMSLWRRLERANIAFSSCCLTISVIR